MEKRQSMSQLTREIMAVKKVKKASVAGPSSQRPQRCPSKIDDEIEDPDVEDIESEDIYKDNKSTCINDNIDGVLEVFDEATCRDLLIGYYEVAKDVKLDEKATRCSLSGCEFDYSSNTYRVMVEISANSITIGEHFLVVKIDSSTGNPKVCSVK